MRRSTASLAACLPRSSDGEFEFGVSGFIFPADALAAFGGDKAEDTGEWSWFEDENATHGVGDVGVTGGGVLPVDGRPFVGGSEVGFRGMMDDESGDVVFIEDG